MAIKKAGLTQARIDGLKPTAKRYALTDIRGLRVLVFPSGRVTFMHRQGHGGQDRETLLGVHPDMTLAQARHIVLTGQPAPGAVAKPATVDDLISEYLATDAAHLRSAQFRGRRLRDLLAPVLDKPVSAVTRPLVIERTNRLLAEGYKGSTVQAYRVLVSMFINWCCDKGHLDRTPLRRLPRIPVERRIRFLDTEGVRRLEIACAKHDDHQMAAVAMLALHSGLRIGEIRALAWQDIDFGAGTVTVLASTSKTRKGRVVGLSRTLRSFLQTVRQHLAVDEPFNIGRVETRFAKLKAAARITQPLTVHSLRHSFASELARRGVPLPTIQALLGHSNISITSIYLHATSREAVDAVTALDGPVTARLVP
jgi:integrase